MGLVTVDPNVDLVGNAPAFEELLSRLPRVARASEAVLVRGETGAGKERIAHALHALGSRAQGPFVAVRCGSFSDTRLELELFGEEMIPPVPGRIAEADGGTLFLDEVESLTTRAQGVLLRVLEDGTYEGPSGARRIDVRVIAATREPLEPRVRAGDFRADLFYRLAVFTLDVPPLRERREDILPLAEHFLRRHQREVPAPARLSAGAISALMAYDWPGNVRELESAMVRGLHYAHDGVIEARDCGIVEDVPAEPVAPAPAATYRQLKRQVIDAFDRQYLTRLMTEYKGNVSRAARAAGKERRDLGKLLKRHGFDPRKFA
jgi:DNA-binding NtrC family response regulator